MKPYVYKREWKDEDGALVFVWECVCHNRNRDDFGGYLPSDGVKESLPCSQCQTRTVLLPPIPDNIKERFTQ